MVLFYCQFLSGRAGVGRWRRSPWSRTCWPPSSTGTRPTWRACTSWSRSPPATSRGALLVCLLPSSVLFTQYPLWSEVLYILWLWRSIWIWRLEWSGLWKFCLRTFWIWPEVHYVTTLYRWRDKVNGRLQNLELALGTAEDVEDTAEVAGWSGLLDRVARLETLTVSTQVGIRLHQFWHQILLKSKKWSSLA